MGSKHHRGHEHGSLLDLTSEAKDSVLLEALPDVEDILILKRNESDLLKTPRTCLLNELHHWLWRRRGRRRSRKIREGQRYEVEFRLILKITLHS